MEKRSCLIYCNCGAGIIREEKHNQLTKAFKELNIDVFELHDICGLSLNEKEVFISIENTYQKKLIVACYPRAIDNIFLQNNIALENYEVLNFRELSVERILKSLESETDSKEENPTYRKIESSLQVPPWYPVIDKSRCTLCGQCARFCVFGVYKFNKKSLEVIHPLSCKNNCPACGRTCPASAIIFPRLPESSALSGAIPGEKVPPSKNKPNDGLFVLLNERNNARRNIFRQGVIQQAEEEKRKAIEEFKNGMKKK